ncbi:MAG: thioredoxin domain-containing protein [Bacteroidota bacterium]
MAESRKPNRLIHEKSPYLLQHAYNPVNWYAWGEEAFATARAEQKPIFLSTGYSTCHWCHVMEHESFENDSIAALMNAQFVCIKVDREERPDVDKVYMTALQSMGQNGGWPMSMFLTPELKPFYGGTYFPPESRYGRAGFLDLLKRIHEVWTNDRQKVLESAEGITTYLRQASAATTSGSFPTEHSLDTCFSQFDRSFDNAFGGFNGAPKFPRPSTLTFLMHYFKRKQNADALEMCATTLRKMSEGGIYDHVGGGFHRYSVDAEWRVPHFEKMLYDQAQLVTSCVDVYLATKDPYYADVARDVLEYVMRDMTDAGGGFYSAEDADSSRPDSPDEKGEGVFYVWSAAEIQDALGQDAALFMFHFGVEETGNALADPQHEFTGQNILYIAHSIQETAKEFNLTETQVVKSIECSKKVLFDIRTRRPRPHLDDKILTSWNGLMISAFARAYQALDDSRHLDTATRSANFVLTKLSSTDDNTLLRRYRDGEAKYEAHLDDYAFLVQGLLDLYEASFDLRWLRAAITLTETQVGIFWDDSAGGFFDTSGKDPSILVRMKEQYDGAEPAGNSIAVMNLLRLSRITGRKEWRTLADRALAFFSGTLTQHPHVMPQMAAALDFAISSPIQIVIAGKATDPHTVELLREVRSHYLPNHILIVTNGSAELGGVAAFASTLKSINGAPTVYICENYSCQLPTSEVTVVREQLLKQR